MVREVELSTPVTTFQVLHVAAAQCVLFRVAVAQLYAQPVTLFSLPGIYCPRGACTAEPNFYSGRSCLVPACFQHQLCIPVVSLNDYRHNIQPGWIPE